MLRRVFYVSEIAPTTTSLDIRAIVSASLIWNRRHDATGLLIASRRHFAQVLECRDEEMELVLLRIRRDAHHHSMHIQVDEPVNQRRFGRWAMAYVQRDDLADELRRLHSEDVGEEQKSAMLARLEQAGEDSLPTF